MKIQISDIPLFRVEMEEKGQLAGSSIDTYTKSLEKFFKTDPDLENINDYNDFLIKMTIKKRSGHYYSAIRKFIEFKITDSNLKKKILENLIKPKKRFDTVHQRRHLSRGDLLDIINLMNEKHRVISLLQNLTGVRIGDVLRMKRGSIMSEEYKGKPVLKLNILGKGGKRNTVFIHDKVAQDVILNYTTVNFNHEDYYFLELGKMKNRPGDYTNEHKLMTMNYNWYWSDLKQALTTLGINRKDFSTHDFRRCFARRAWEAKKDIYRLQSLLNHADPKVTLRYLQQSGMQNIDYHAEMQE